MSEPIGVIAAIRQKRFRFWHFTQQNLRAFIIADLACRSHHKQHEAGSSGRLSSDRYGDKHPLFQQAGWASVSFEVRGVDHQLFSSVRRFGQLGKDQIEHAHAAPAHKTVLQGFRRAIGLGRIFPLQPVPDHRHHPTDHAPIIDPFNSMGSRKIRLNPCHLLSRQHQCLAHGYLRPQVNQNPSPSGILKISCVPSLVSASQRQIPTYLDESGVPPGLLTTFQVPIVGSQIVITVSSSPRPR